MQPMPTATASRARKRWTYADYCRIPDDGKRHEIIDGEHYVNPTPRTYHQLVSARLLHELMKLIADPGLGTVLCAPLDVHLGPGTIVQPDLTVVRRRNRAIIGELKLTGVPDLLVEILSPSSHTYDGRIKLRRYERAGVREYWIVDPEAHTVAQFVLRNGAYGQPRMTADRVALRVFRGMALDLGRVW